MDNVKLSINGKVLSITIDLSKRLGPSKSGKSEGIASTHGNTALPGLPDVKLGLNCYTTAK